MEIFARKVAKNEVKEYIKSEPIPLDNDERLVKVVVGDTFNKIVNDESKDVLIVLHVPHCSKCDSLASTLEKLALLVNIIILRSQIVFTGFKSVTSKVKNLSIDSTVLLINN